MCWSAKSSLTAYIVGTIASVALLWYGNSVDKNIGLFFLAVVQMQLIEFFIWRDQKCGRVNNLASRMIVPDLTFQVVAMVMGAYVFKSTILSDAAMYYLMSFVVAFAASTIGFYFYRISNQVLCSAKLRNQGIQWDVGSHNVIDNLDPVSMVWKLVYYGALFGFPLLWKSDLKKYLFVISGLVSWLWIRHDNKHTWKSRWCFPSALVPTFYVLLMILRIK